MSVKLYLHKKLNKKAVVLISFCAFPPASLSLPETTLLWGKTMTPSQMRGRLDAPTVEVLKLSSKAAFEIHTWA